MSRACIFIICFLLLVAVPFGCTMKNPVSPYMVDRTEGWSPSVICPCLFDASIDGANREILYSFVFSGSILEKDRPIELDLNEEDSVILEKALYAAFGEQYQGIGKDRVTVTDLGRNGIKVFSTKKAAALINGRNNLLLQCIDPEMQPQISLDRFSDITQGIVNVNVDIAKLTKEELSLYQRTLAYGLEGDLWELSENELPLTAKTAFDYSVKSVYNRYAGAPGILGTIGGAFKVYYSEYPDGYLIVNDQFVQILDRMTGKCLFIDAIGMDLSEMSRETRGDG